jgi:hypothetical protein
MDLHTTIVALVILDISHPPEVPVPGSATMEVVGNRWDHGAFRNC